VFLVGNGSGGRALTNWISYLASSSTPPLVPPPRAYAMVGTVIGSVRETERCRRSSSIR